MMNEWQQKEPATRGAGRSRWRRLKVLLVGGAVLLAAGLYLSYRYSPNRPVVYCDIAEHFKYGSIGSDFVPIFGGYEEGTGLPVAIVRILPRMFPEYLPAGGPKDYTAFGFIQEPGQPLPIGFSTRRCGIDLTGINCAACHVGSVRASERDPPQLHLAMPANTVNLQGFFEFFFDCGRDERFNPDAVLAEIEKDRSLFALDRLIYRKAVTDMKTGLLTREQRLGLFLTPHNDPRFGPGRVDTFNPYKAIQFSAAYHEGLSPQEKIGTTDFPSVWNQRPREGMHLHWDGNNTSVRERNVSAALGAGATRDHVDLRHRPCHALAHRLAATAFSLSGAYRQVEIGPRRGPVPGVLFPLPQHRRRRGWEGSPVERNRHGPAPVELLHAEAPTSPARLRQAVHVGIRSLQEDRWLCHHAARRSLGACAVSA